MTKFSSKSTLKLKAPSITVTVIVIGALLVGYLLTMLSAVHSFLLVILLLISVCIFIWPVAGLYLVIFSMLLSPEIITGDIGGKATLGRGITLRLEDFLLVLIALSWLARGAVDKSMGLFRKTPLNQPIAAYILVCFLATLWGKTTGNVQGKAGFFFVLKYFEYMIVFFMVVNYVNSADQAKRLLFCLFLTCFIVSVYGLIQIPGGGRVSAPFEGQVRRAQYLWWLPGVHGSRGRGFDGPFERYASAAGVGCAPGCPPIKSSLHPVSGLISGADSSLHGG